MNALDFNSVGIKELNAKELQETDGGILGLVVAYALQAGVVACLAGGIVVSFTTSYNVTNSVYNKN